MTLPFERTREMLDVRLFLPELTDPGLTHREPRALRGRAASLLKHFPALMALALRLKNALDADGIPAGSDT